MGFSFLATAGYAAAAVVLGLVGLRLSRASTPRGLRLLGRLPLEPRRAVHVVEIAGRVLVLSSSESGLQLLTELDPAAASKLEPARASSPLQALFAYGRKA